MKITKTELASAEFGRPSGTAIPTFRIQPSRGWIPLDLRELWEHRELIYFLTWSDINTRYKQTVLGVAWAIIQPVLTMMVFSVFFGKLVKVPSDGIPYPIFSYAALVPWTLFANGVSRSPSSLVGYANLIKKVYFPRLAVPLSVLFSVTIDFLLAFLVLLLMMLYYGIVPSLNVLWLPLFLLLTLVTSLGTALWLSALNVKFRDIHISIPFLIQFWFFVTPIVYSSTLLADPWRTLYGINPMAGVVEGFRWCLLNTATKPGPIIWVSALTALAILVSGAFFFRRLEKTFSDLV